MGTLGDFARLSIRVAKSLDSYTQRGSGGGGTLIVTGTSDIFVYDMKDSEEWYTKYQ